MVKCGTVENGQSSASPMDGVEQQLIKPGVGTTRRESPPVDAEEA
jgi:hypothetical protein